MARVWCIRKPNGNHMFSTLDLLAHKAWVTVMLFPWFSNNDLSVVFRVNLTGQSLLKVRMPLLRNIVCRYCHFICPFEDGHTKYAEPKSSDLKDSYVIPHLCNALWKEKCIILINILSIPSLTMTYHYGVCMYMVPLKKWAQYFPDSNFTSAISLCFKLSFDEGPIFTILYWKAVQGLKHIYVVKNTSSERINSLYFILSKPFLAFRGH